jgi:hypothetical protein
VSDDEAITLGKPLREGFSRFDVVNKVRLVNDEYQALQLSGHDVNLAKNFLRIFGGPFPLLHDGILLGACLQGSELLLDVRAQEKCLGELHGLFPYMRCSAAERTGSFGQTPGKTRESRDGSRSALPNGRLRNELRSQNRGGTGHEELPHALRLKNSTI